MLPTKVFYVTLTTFGTGIPVTLSTQVQKTDVQAIFQIWPENSAKKVAAFSKKKQLKALKAHSITYFYEYNNNLGLVMEANSWKKF